METNPEDRKAHVETAEIVELDATVVKKRSKDCNEITCRIITDPKQLEIEIPASKVPPPVLPRLATTYKLETFKKNALIVFNHVEPWKTRSPRIGTMKDMDVLKYTFKKFGFEVAEHAEKTKEEIFRLLKEFTSRDFTEYGCIGVVVMTHGFSNGTLAASDMNYSEIKIIDHLKDATKQNCTLWAKPKLYIVQACRGSQKKVGVSYARPPQHLRRDSGEGVDPAPYHLPEEAELLLLHSCFDGCVSQRDPHHGTWFIQALCQKIDALAYSDDLESIFTEVRREVGIERYATYDRSTQEVYAQIPVSMSTLTRKLYLRRYGDLPPVDTDTTSSRSDSRADISSVHSHTPIGEASMNCHPQLHSSLHIPEHSGSQQRCSCYLNHFNLFKKLFKILR